MACRNGVVLLYTVGAAGAGYVYLRIFKGWRLSDFMYVTRSSLSKSISSVTAGAVFLLDTTLTCQQCPSAMAVQSWLVRLAAIIL